MELRNPPGGSPAVLADPMMPAPHVIARVIEETEDTFSFELEPRSGELPQFTPGQFNVLYVFGVGEVPISISSDPDERGLLVHTTREVGTVTRAMRALKTGDVIGLRGPYGRGWPVEQAAGGDVLLIPGGIGLAPLRPALYHVLRRRADYGKVVLLYGARNPEELLFKEELAEWRARFDLDVFVTVDRASEDWYGNVGLVTALVKQAPFDPTRTSAFICGPEAMMRFTAQALAARGVAKASIYLSMERNMKCAVGFCGHCQYGPHFVCKDGPVFSYQELETLLGIWEV